MKFLVRPINSSLKHKDRILNYEIYTIWTEYLEKLQ